MSDTAGRVHIPKLALEQSRIGNRVRVEIQEGRVILHSVEGHQREIEPSEPEEETTILFEEEPLPEPEQGVEKKISYLGFNGGSDDRIQNCTSG